MTATTERNQIVSIIIGLARCITLSIYVMYGEISRATTKLTDETITFKGFVSGSVVTLDEVLCTSFGKALLTASTWLAVIQTFCWGFFPTHNTKASTLASIDNMITFVLKVVRVLFSITGFTTLATWSRWPFTASVTKTSSFPLLAQPVHPLGMSDTIFFRSQWHRITSMWLFYTRMPEVSNAVYR